MTRIVVLCDGTWNSPDIGNTTHVHVLSDMLANSGEQKVKYFPGVGVNLPREEGGTFVGRGFNRIFGGATGFGLGKKVKEAYKFVAENYKDGDEVYLFGFSRGAYTARSVAGMIRKCGIVTDTSNRGIRKAFRLYRKTGDHNHPDRILIREKRAKMSPGFATSEKDQSLRDGPKVPIVNIAYVGVWDTVGARGIPEPLFGALASVFNQLYAFHDTELSSLVKAARHAVAVDERRVFYKPALWDNLDRLNTEAGGANYQQKWFVGDHAIVGGSALPDAVACQTLQWIAAGAPELTYAPGKDPHDLTLDPTVDIDRFNNPSKIYKIANNLLQWRSGATSEEDVDPGVKQRADARSDYRPQSLRSLLQSWGLG